LLGAAVSEETAEFLGSFTDGLITTGRPRREMESIIAAYRKGGGEGKPIVVQHALYWATNETDALHDAYEQWRFCSIKGERLWVTAPTGRLCPRRCGRAPLGCREVIRVSADLGLQAQWIAEYSEAGVAEVYCHNVGRNQAVFIETFGRLVLPQLAG
jgi:coenzyme F420-dependent glucose-6-phosphate dehydrogenase